MSCARTRQMLDAWHDGELDAATAAEMNAHIGICPDCSTRRAEREQLRSILRRQAPRFVASDNVFGAAMLAAACAAVVTSMLLRHGGIDAGADVRQEQLVARHVASLARVNPVDVASSDQHVVKPWFHGKIDFAPAVRDLSAHGISLRGARLDSLGGQQAVAVVYQVRQHPINLFVWRDSADAPIPIKAMTARGFSIVTWSVGGLAYAAIADIDVRELEQFARLIQAPPAP
jgi:anti-sigma factor RsiW